MAYRPLNQERTRWQIDIYPSGRKGARKRHNFSGTEQEAIELEMSLIREYAQKIPANPTIGQAIPGWLNYCKANRSATTNDDIGRVLKKLRQFFGSIRFVAFNSTHVDDYINLRRAQGVKDRTINKELSYLSSLLRWAVKNGYAMGIAKVELIPKVTSPNPIILTLEEVQGLIDNIEPHYLCILLLNYDAGLRRTSSLRIKAEDVDLASNTFQALGKGGKYGTFDITTSRLRAAFEYLLAKVDKGYLFVNPKTGKPYYSIRKALKRAAEKAGIKKRVYVHLLRHSFCSHGVAAGINLRVMQKLLQHSTIKVTEKYLHFTPDVHKAETKKFVSLVERERGPMVKVANGKRYDSGKATLVATQNNHLSIIDAAYCKEDLFLTANGSWFLVGEGGSRTRYARPGDMIGRDLVPLSPDEAQGWLEQNDYLELLEKYFSGAIEDA